jgi:hypothetical protein
MKGTSMWLLVIALIASLAVIGFVVWRWYVAPREGLRTAEAFLEALRDGSPEAERRAYALLPDAWRAKNAPEAFTAAVRPLVEGLRGTTPRVEKRDMLAGLARVTERLDGERTAAVMVRRIGTRWRVVHARVHGDELKAE